MVTGMEADGIAGGANGGAARRAQRASELQTIVAPARVAVAKGQVVLTFNLPRQGVSLVKLTW